VQNPASLVEFFLCRRTAGNRKIDLADLVSPGDLPPVSATALAVAKSATKPDFRIVLAIRFNHMARLLGGALVGKIEQCCSSPEVQRFYGSHAIASCIFAANNSENSERGFR